MVNTLDNTQWVVAVQEFIEEYPLHVVKEMEDFDLIVALMEKYHGANGVFYLELFHLIREM